MLTSGQVLRRLEAEVKRAGSMRALARLISVSPTFVSDILAGKRNPSGKVLEHLGLKRKTGYVRVDGGN